MRFLDFFFKDNPFKTRAATQCHINLTVCKSASADVDYDSIEGLALTFMNSNGPGKTEWILGKGAHGLGDDFLKAFIESIPEELPGIGV